MQNAYVGDIGDYGKYGLLRRINQTDLRLAINWYLVAPHHPGKQDDGKFIQYLFNPGNYRKYDPVLFDELYRIVHLEKDRSIQRIEQSQLLSAAYYTSALCSDRSQWHKDALHATKDANIVFLDPDNGLETYNMYKMNSATEKHVRWDELADYYRRGQSVILYQHRPQMTKKEICIQQLLNFNYSYLYADCVYILEFPQYTNRFYCFFTHQAHSDTVQSVCSQMAQVWKGMCNPIFATIG